MLLEDNVLFELLYSWTSGKVVISYVSGSLYIKIVFMWETYWKENDKVISLTPGVGGIASSNNISFYI